ncbi:hypothetical protein B1H10_00355 [candidate division KSB1 bacterium 4484_188]|nr:MAG: hypothetical protein B1H10_00355 [candidate division KSB1 bacterium 4484_188]
MSFKTLLWDQDFWLILIATIGFGADAAAEGKLTILRIITIVAMAGIVVSYLFRKIKLQKEKRVPYLVVIGKGDSQYRDTRSQVETALADFRIHVHELKRAFGLHGEDWIFRRESQLSTDPEVWKTTITKIENKFWRLAERIPGRKTYHFFMNGPATLAFAMGATIGSRNEYVFYHYMPASGRNPYHDIINFEKSDSPEGHHKLKTKIKKYKMIHASGEDKLNGMPRRDVLVALYLAGHSPVGDVTERSKQSGLPLIVIQSKFKGTIPLDQDWILLSQEVSSVLLDIAGRENVERLHLFLSVPLPIAFCVGSAMGKFVRATVYNYFPGLGGYEKVFNLEEC